MAVFIDHQAVERTLTWCLAIDLLEEASRHEAAGRTFVSPKFNAEFERGSMRILFAADYDAGYGATKAYHTINGIGTRYLVSLIDLGTGRLLALIDGRHLTDLRTGAASGLAARHVPMAGPVTVGLIGSGHQARAQLFSLAAVYRLARVSIYSPTVGNRERFAAEMSEALAVPVTAAASAEAAVSGCAVVVTASKARSARPVLQREWLSGCRLLCAVGNTRPQFVEVDPRCFTDAALTIVDSLHAFDEAGELIAATRDGRPKHGARTTLADLVARRSACPPEGLIAFKSVGTALQDLALAGRCYELQRDTGGTGRLPDLLCTG